MSKTDTEGTLDKLRHTIARFGLPKIIISDNGTQFTSDKFGKFGKENNIEHRTSPPYYPARNGLAENMVASVKRGILKLNYGNDKKTNVSILLDRFLYCYRNTPHATRVRQNGNVKLLLLHYLVMKKLDSAVFPFIEK